MNYRHAYHAGNFGDCLKQALLFWILRALQRKTTPLSILETHAGAGAYDLSAEPALRTGEWRAGIGRLRAAPPRRGPLADYLAALPAFPFFPGTPMLARSVLRPGDRLICCELHPEEFRLLKRHLGHDRSVALHQRDAWEALSALLPPEPRRGLAFIDPPYEDPGEYRRVAQGLIVAHHRWPRGVLAAWYPIKHRTPIRTLHATLAAASIPDIVAAELTLRTPTDPKRLNGAGMVIVNPPFGFQGTAKTLLGELEERLNTGEEGGGIRLSVIATEKPTTPLGIVTPA